MIKVWEFKSDVLGGRGEMGVIRRSEVPEVLVWWKGGGDTGVVGRR